MSAPQPNPEAGLWALVAQIPKGQVTTYGHLAAHLGLHPRRVGALLHRNPDPARYSCHRVVAGDGSLAGRFAYGGIAGQAARLSQEGIQVVKERVDLSRHLWQPK